MSTPRTTLLFAALGSSLVAAVLLLAGAAALLAGLWVAPGRAVEA